MKQAVLSALLSASKSPFALALDFKKGIYISAGKTYPALSAMPGYAYTDLTDNLPTIDASGYHGSAADHTDLAVSAALPSGDFIAWAVLNTTGAPAATVSPFAYSTAGAGTSNERILPSVVTSGSLTWVITAAGAGQSAPAAQVNTITATAGRPVILIRRKGGLYSAARRQPSGTIAITADANPNGNVPAATTVEIGAAYSNTQWLDGIVEGFYQLNGTFDDTYVTNLLTNA